MKNVKIFFWIKFKDEKKDQEEKKESIWTKEEMFLFQKGVKDI